MKRVFLLVILSLVLLCSCAVPPPEEPTPAPVTNPPSVTGLSLLRAAPGTEIEINGSNFFSMRSANEVWIGDLPAPVVFASSDKLRILVSPAGPGQVPLSIHTPQGYSSKLDFEVLPSPQPTLPLGTTSQHVLQLSDQLLVRLTREPAGRELTEEIEEARYFVSEAIESLKDADEERLQTVDMVLNNSKSEGRIRELLVYLQGTPHITAPSITALIGAVAGFSHFLIGIFVTPAAPPIGIALITTGIVEGVAGIVGAIYLIDEDLERQGRK